MRIIGAYIVVVLIWSTTPLAIHFSNSSLTFITAVTLRMICALLGFSLWMLLVRKKLIETRKDWLVFAASALGLFPNILLVYWAAQHIASGLMSVLMGIYPFMVGLASCWLLRDNPFTLKKIIALVVAVLGLVVIHFAQLALGEKAMLGVSAMLMACVFWAISSVLVKKLGTHMDPVRNNTGCLMISVPLFIAAWYVLDGEWPTAIDSASIWGVTYLVVCGSLISHTLYFYVLRHCTVSTMSLITLMTPLLAITWGVLLADESLSASLVIGAALILAGLGAYLNVTRVLSGLLALGNRMRGITAGKQAIPVREGRETS